MCGGGSEYPVTYTLREMNYDNFSPNESSDKGIRITDECNKFSVKKTGLFSYNKSGLN
jgi:hypothetical protein